MAGRRTYLLARPRSVPGDLRAHLVSDQSCHLAGLGVAADLSLGEHDLVVDGDLEAALRRGDQFEAFDDRRPTGEQFVRQTDGTRNVVSGNAELDEDAMARVEHGGLPGWRSRLIGRRYSERSSAAGATATSGQDGADGRDHLTPSNWAKSAS